MIQRLGRRQYKVYAMDIESHNDVESIAKQETSCWLGCLLDDASKPEDPSSYFYSIEEFIDRIEALSAPKRNKAKTRLCKNVAVYIYNLSFEWSFILPKLLERGFHFSSDIGEETEYSFSSVSTKSCSSVWEVKLKFGKKHGVVLFRDLAKLYGGGLANVAKAFGLETQKGEIDYRLNRLHGHVVTDEERFYCYKDTRIIVEILQHMQEKQDKDFWGSCSMASYSMRKLIRRGWPRATRPYLKFRERYPVLEQEETEFLRRGVGGGITYAPAKWQFKDIKQRIGHIDAHQMHPSSAYMHMFPWGKGTYFQGEPLLNHICACRIRISYDDVRLHSVISLIGLPFVTDKELVVWDFEIPTMKKVYVNLKIDYIDGYAYRMSPLPWRKYYADNYNKRLIAKANKDSFNILYYKLLNNSSYGKLLEKPHNETIANTVRPDGIIDSDIIPKDPSEFVTGAKYTYIPVGSCIPAYSRVCLIETALKISPDGSKIVYFDTDSIFFIWDEETEEAWSHIPQQDFLGGWGWEEFIDRAQFTAPKRYKTLTGGKLTVKAGGINFKDWLKDNSYDKMEDVPYEEVNIVNSKWKVQRAYRVKGGTLIEFQEKDMSVQPKYEWIHRRNTEDGDENG
jgi:hypothetical protein